MLSPKLAALVEKALAERGPLTLTYYETRELAWDAGIADPHELNEPVEIRDGEDS